MVIGEEAGRCGDSDWCWYLDPVDGTTRFVSGDPKWMTLIALAYRHEIVLGVVDYPALRERWWASRGQGAFHDGHPISVSRTKRLSQAVISDDWREHIATVPTIIPSRSSPGAALKFGPTKATPRWRWPAARRISPSQPAATPGTTRR